MATIEVVSGEKPYYTVRITVADERVFDQLVFVDKLASAVPATLAEYAADMEAQVPPLDGAPTGD